MRSIAVLWLVLIPVVTRGYADTGVDITETYEPPELVYISGGSFLLGDTRGDGSTNERPAHSVTLASFYLSRTEVTFAEFDRFSDETGRPRPTDNGWGRDDRPAINVSWLDAAEYCNWLSERESLDSFYVITATQAYANWSSAGYRLPTEAEWEYAAAGGGLEATATSGPPEGWVQGSSGGMTRPVATRAPDALGLHDMLGNVWEWSNDWYGVYSAIPGSDPRGPESGQYRVLRGGSWYDPAVNVRVTARNWHPPTRRLPMVGFRVARSASPPPDDAAG